MRRHSGGNSQGHQQAQDGFSIIEVMVSMVVLTVGLVSLLGVFGLSMASTQSTQQDMIAKQLADEAYESIVTARNTSQITFDDIQNVGATNCPVTGASTCGIFLIPAQQIYNAGADGIYGTADDSASGQRQTLHDPGPDGIFGTSDDVYIPLSGYQRTIAIGSVYNSESQVIDSLRSVTITIQYTTSQTRSQKTYILNSYISQFQ
ncbi:MAG: prepilin-type N-terminal cleavage/methylation domain-containing protein [Terriglobales bacterium]|jgi:prepilin-type N-terminal cleavage/methylation domain-containing protein